MYPQLTYYLYVCSNVSYLQLKSILDAKVCLLLIVEEVTHELVCQVRIIVIESFHLVCFDSLIISLQTFDDVALDTPLSLPVSVYTHTHTHTHTQTHTQCNQCASVSY